MNTDFVNLLKPLVLNSTILANKDFVNTYNQVQITDLTDSWMNHIASLTEPKVSHWKIEVCGLYFWSVFAVDYFKSMLIEFISKVKTVKSLNFSVTPLPSSKLQVVAYNKIKNLNYWYIRSELSHFSRNFQTYINMKLSKLDLQLIFYMK